MRLQRKTLAYDWRTVSVLDYWCLWILRHCIWWATIYSFNCQGIPTNLYGAAEFNIIQKIITEKAAHVTMAKSCIVYLSMYESEHSKATGISSIKTDAIEHTFLDYAARSWAAHFQQARDVSIVNLVNNLCDLRSQRFQTWFQSYLEANNFSISPHLTHLIMASYTGFDMVVQELLDREAAVDEQGIHGWTPLHWATILAADNGNLRMGDEFLMDWSSSDAYHTTVRSLLDKGPEQMVGFKKQVMIAVPKTKDLATRWWLSHWLRISVSKLTALSGFSVHKYRWEIIKDRFFQSCLRRKVVNEDTWWVWLVDTTEIRPSRLKTTFFHRPSIVRGWFNIGCPKLADSEANAKLLSHPITLCGISTQRTRW